MQNMDVEKKHEIILQNTTLQRVMQYLTEKLKPLGGMTIPSKKEGGTIITYTVQGVLPSQLNKINVDYTSVVIPNGDVEKAYGYWETYTAMNFESFQLQPNTVRIKAECRHPFIMPVFDRIWADMLKDFKSDG